MFLVEPADFVEGLVQPAGLVDVDAGDAMFVRSFASELGGIDVESLTLSRIFKTIGKEATLDVDIVRRSQDEFRDDRNFLGMKETAVFVTAHVLRCRLPFDVREVHLIAIQSRCRWAVIIIDGVVAGDLFSWCLCLVCII